MAKQKKPIAVTAYITADTKEKIQIAAQSEDRSESKIAGIIIDNHFKNLKK